MDRCGELVVVTDEGAQDVVSGDDADDGVVVDDDEAGDVLIDHAPGCGVQRLLGRDGADRSGADLPDGGGGAATVSSGGRRTP